MPDWRDYMTDLSDSPAAQAPEPANQDQHKVAVAEPTGTFLDYLQDEHRPDNIPPGWERVKEQVKKAHPDKDEGLLQQAYEVQRRHTIARGLARAMPEQERTLGLFSGEESLPFVSGLKGLYDANEYGRALQRVQAGGSGQGDLQTIADYEERQQREKERGSTLGGALGQMVGKLPAIAGEAMVGGGIAGAGKVAVPIFTRAGLARNAVATALMPSLYAEQFARGNVTAGRDPLDPRGFPAAYALGMLQNAVLGKASQIGAKAGGGLLGKAAAGAATGVGGQAVADVAGSAVAQVLPYAEALDTHFGTIGSWRRGERGEALRHAAAQAILFGAFGALHGKDPREALKQAATVVDEAGKKGLSAEAAGKKLQEEVGAKLEEIAKAKEPEQPAPTPAATDEAAQESAAQRERLNRPVGPEEQLPPSTLEQTAEEVGKSPQELRNEARKLMGLPPEEPPQAPPAAPSERPPPPGPPGPGWAPTLPPPKPGVPAAFPETAPQAHPLLKPFQEVFPEGKLTPRGELEAKIGDRTVYVNYDADRHMARIDFEAGKPGVGAKLQAGSGDLAKGLLRLVDRLKDTGVGIEYRSIDTNRGTYRTPRADIYAKFLQKAGYEQTGGPGVDGTNTYTWRKAAAPESTPTPAATEQPQEAPPAAGPTETPAQPAPEAKPESPPEPDLANLKPRTREMLTDFVSGMSQDAVGEKHGITGERVRQIFEAELGGLSPTEAMKALKENDLVDRLSYGLVTPDEAMAEAIENETAASRAKIEQQEGEEPVKATGGKQKAIPEGMHRRGKTHVERESLHEEALKLIGERLLGKTKKAKTKIEKEIAALADEIQKEMGNARKAGNNSRVIAEAAGTGPEEEGTGGTPPAPQPVRGTPPAAAPGETSGRGPTSAPGGPGGEPVKPGQPPQKWSGLRHFLSDEGAAVDLDRLHEFGKGIWSKLFGKKTEAKVKPNEEGLEGYYHLHVNGKDRGEMVLGNADATMERRAATGAFPGVVAEGSRVSRIHGVDVDKALRGKGLGQMLYLGAMIDHGADWYYNSQADAPAVNVYKALAAKNWAEVHWRRGEPDWNEDGGAHIIRITPEGREAYRLMTEEPHKESAGLESARTQEQDYLRQMAEWSDENGRRQKEGLKPLPEPEAPKGLESAGQSELFGSDYPVYPANASGLQKKFAGPGWYESNFGDLSIWTLKAEEFGGDLATFSTQSHDGRFFGSILGKDKLPEQSFGEDSFAGLVKKIESRLAEKLQEQHEVDYRPTETTPEDYYAFRQRQPSRENIEQRLGKFKGLVLDFLKEEHGFWDYEKTWEQLKSAARHVGNEVSKLAGAIAPATTRISRRLGEALTKVHAADGYIASAVPDYLNRVLGKDSTPEQAQLWGEALMEKRQRAARDQMHQAAARATQRGDKDNALKFSQAAQDVETSIGKPHSLLKDDAAYQKVIQSPEFKAMEGRYEKELTPLLEQWYRQAEGLGLNDPIENLTQLKETPFTARAYQEGESLPEGGTFASKRGRLQNLKQNKIPGAHPASLAGERYVTDLRDIIARTMASRYKTAMKAEALRTAVAEGFGEFAPPGQRGNLGEHKAVELPFVSPPKGTQEAVPGREAGFKDKSFYIAEPMYQDFRDAWAVDQPFNPLPGTRLLNLGALASTAEAVYHSKNLITMLAKPGMNPVNLWTNLVGRMTGNPDTMARLTELARIGARKPTSERPGLFGGGKYDVTGYMGRALEVLSDTMRLTADQAFDSLSKETLNGKPLIENTETARRNFINQTGQYIKTAQPKWMQFFRDTGIGPFVTAGTNYWVQGMKAMIGGHGLETTGPAADLALRGRMMARVLGVAGTAMLANYLLHKRVDGDDKTPIGAIKLYDKSGHTVYFDLTTFTGATRGLRQTGLLATIEGQRAEKPGGKVIDRAVEDIAHNLLHPLMGPPVAFAHTALTGKNSIGMQLAPKAGVGESQARQNVQTAAIQANPVLATLTGRDLPPGAQEGTLPRAVKLLGPYGPKEKVREPIVGSYYDRLKDLEEHRRASEERRKGIAFPQEREYRLLSRFKQSMDTLNHAIKGEGLRNGQVIQGPKPSPQREAQLRQMQADLARRALELAKGP